MEYRMHRFLGWVLVGASGVAIALAGCSGKTIGAGASALDRGNGGSPTGAGGGAGGAVTGSGGATVTIMFKEFGIRLNFIPTVTPRGTVHLQVAPEVSSLDFSNAVTVEGFQIPAIDVRRVKTEVELAQGQSFAIGGLLDNRVSETLTKIPFIGSIPILGKFFQSVNRTRSNTELIVIVTPELVQPMPAGGIPPPNYPLPFMPPNSRTPMHSPETGTANATPAPATIPVEQLIRSMQQPQQSLPSDSGGSQNSGATSGASGATGSGASGSSTGP